MTHNNQNWTAPRKDIFGFAMYDFANSAYTTVIITVLFGNIFWFYIVGDEQQGNWLWSLALGASYCLTVMLAPILGNALDHAPRKKPYLAAMSALTILATAALYWVQPGGLWLALLLICLSNIGFSLGEVVISSFLPQLASRTNMGRVSGYAWGLGYLGGISSALVAMAVTGFGATQGDYEIKRWVGPLTALFFFFACLPTFLLMKETPTPEAERTAKRGAWQSTIDAWHTLKQHKDMQWFLASYFSVYCGLAIVISFSFIYGEQVIGLSATQAAALFVILNLASAVGAVLFGVLQSRIGDKWVYNCTLVLWVIAVVSIYCVVPLSSALADMGISVTGAQVFMACGGLAGACLGATQSASRAITGVLSPAGKSGQFFSLWGLVTKLSAAVGLVAYGALQLWLGVHNAILLCAVFFIIGLVLTLGLNMQRGIALAD